MYKDGEVTATSIWPDRFPSRSTISPEQKLMSEGNAYSRKDFTNSSRSNPLELELNSLLESYPAIKPLRIPDNLTSNGSGLAIQVLLLSSLTMCALRKP
jgi:hypothetical protein